MSDQPELSIVVPALNEEDNVQPLVDEIRKTIIDAGIDAELIVVDDGSTDDTLARLIALAKQYPWVRPMHRDKALGQSAAMQAGIQASRGKYVATLDADLQNDPADLPAMLDVMRAGEADMVQGDRSANRRDTVVRRITSWVGRTARSTILGDGIRDTGCTTRVVKREFAVQFPLQFKGMHRFMPVYARMLGARVVERPVHHRPRVAGVAKYGVLNRGFVGLIDCFAMRWMIRRHRNWTTAQPVSIPREEAA
jgi:dolichol-phosphate mannosyltransferase